MIVTREQLLKIGKLIHDIKLKNLKCNINLKYKILKLENIIKEVEPTDSLWQKIYIDIDVENNYLLIINHREQDNSKLFYNSIS